MTTELIVKSGAFENGALIPQKHAGDGENVAPPLQWGGAPAGTKEFAIISDDPDAPVTEPWVHWVVYGIPAGVTSLPEGKPGASIPSSPPGMKEGKGTSGKTGYSGPAPPRGHGRHRYYFKVYALDTNMALPPGAAKAALLKAMEGHVLAQGQTMGAYER
ncbi:MAG: YbhB/YbcL family Raf kinase inhibitor-like protein [bacterium]|nr:YbhB/YbcL family Raf kinase inhibitor-like protein [Candidatus Sumerlaeota bacterium]